MRLDARSPLVIDTHDLGRRPGSMRTRELQMPAPADLGIELLAVPEGSPIELELRLEAVMEGVLVSGRARVQLDGECSRCLTELDDDLEVDLQELYVYAESEAEDDEAARLDGELADLEPMLRDAVVLALPFQPVCRDDCRGLCLECGANLNDDPEHAHDAEVDPRWSALAQLTTEDAGTSGPDEE